MTLRELNNVIDLTKCRLLIHVHKDDPVNDFDSKKHSPTYLSVLANRDVLNMYPSYNKDGTYLYVEVSNV